MLKKIISYYKNFGFLTTNSIIFNRALFKVTKKQKFKEREFTTILKYLDKHFSDVMSNGSNSYKTLDANYKVWVFWWQGFSDKNVPIIITKCVASIKNNFHQHEVILITKDNYQQYTDIPQYIIDKLNKGVITITHFSDIMRASLLSKHGGVWMDATIYMTDSIESDLDGFHFYSNKLPRDGKFETHVDKANWSAFFLAGGAENPIFINLRNILYKYWQTHTTLINYFLVDYCIKLAYDKFKNVRGMIDKVPVNNVNIHDLSSLLNNKFDQQFFENLTANTKLFKLTYKMDFTKAARDSYYHYILNKQGKA